MKSPNTPTHSSPLIAIGVWWLFVVAIIGSGCGLNPTTPAEEGPITTSAPVFLHGPSVTPDTFALASSDGEGEDENEDEDAEKSWYEVAGGTAIKYASTVIRGSRYTLLVPAGAVQTNTRLTVSERDSDVLEIELGPHGTQFTLPVTLVVNYAGTNADPTADHYDGSIPAFFYFNPDTGLWEQVKGTNDVTGLTYTVLLNHFSRYAMGTAGWD